MSGLLNIFGSPGQANRVSLNGAGSEARSTKRKAKRDPYEYIAGGDDDDDDVIPSRKTPVSRRTAASRVSSVTPGSIGARSDRSQTARRRPGRPSLSSRGDGLDSPASTRANPSTNPARAKPASAARTQPDSRAPEAPMGGLELLGNTTTADAPAPSTSTTRSEVVNKRPSRNKGKEKQKETTSTQQAQGGEQDDAREEREIERLLKHRMAGDRSGAVELLVQWAGEREQDATWEAEEELQENADVMLYEYWRAQGGRVSALFHKLKNPPPEVYHVFKVLRHERKNRGGFQFEVQWVGHPPVHGETTMESETKLRGVAPKLLDKYWESVGGRDKYLARRRREKARGE
ncbi:hypothetical protein F4802DRAFT_550150 [Xylaria palmicola]|nr:hypothetical protein F4802DRAFT_550150 [Xylaria palmicola]